ncbi:MULTISPECIES: hypothetical protein [unclassified Luteococcus]|uniref:hypothetical protein n=1 Tax=unclassified Luteococcus TaxID=2639923 RepID=UPI00313DC0F7
MTDDPVDALLATMLRDVYPRLEVGARAIIHSELSCDADVYMAVDDMLQFSLLSDVPISTALLDQAEAAINWWWDEELTQRTLGWVAKHRAKHTVAA